MSQNNLAANSGHRQYKTIDLKTNKAKEVV